MSSCSSEGGRRSSAWFLTDIGLKISVKQLLLWPGGNSCAAPCAWVRGVSSRGVELQALLAAEWQRRGHQVNHIIAQTRRDACL